MVQAVFDSVGLLADILLLLALSDSGGLGLQTLLLLGLGLWSVLVEELEGGGGGVAVEGVLELSDRRWDLQSQVEDLLLSLQADVLWPSGFVRCVLQWQLVDLLLDHARQVARGLNILTDTEVSWSLLEERVLQLVSMSCVGDKLKHTLAAFLLAPALLPGKGAAATFFPFGGCH